MVRVLFVCLGNICRSPMAEAVFSQLVREAGLENEIEIDSAGTGDWHVGQRPHHGTLEILRLNKIPEGSRARQIRRSDLEEFDVVVVMDDSNLANVNLLGTGRARVLRLLDLVAEAQDKQVPDPYFDGNFAGVYELVRRGCEELLAELRRDFSL
ncbi:low molecular weight phosphotyrosine protein phosphatase [bacterium]|nr:MAG: low molecular weight phosphotyrosine protein phosphatase [bacterium]